MFLSQVKHYMVTIEAWGDCVGGAQDRALSLKALYVLFIPEKNLWLERAGCRNQFFLEPIVNLPQIVFKIRIISPNLARAA